jgi:circadian clock protein KaiB
MIRRNTKTNSVDTGKSKKQASAKRPPGASSGSASLQRHLDDAAREQDGQRYLLRLYVTGTTPASQRAIERVRQLCEEHLHDRYQLEVIDIYQLPALAKDEQIIATPTLIKVLPAPLRRYIGDLSKVEKILFGMDVREKS